MENLIKARGTSGPTAAAAPWVMLNRKILKDSGSSSSTADAKTTVAACTSSGQPFSVSISIAALPERSSFLYDLLTGGIGSTPSSQDDNEDTKDLDPQIIAAHDECVLIETRVPRPGFWSRVNFEYFLYQAGAGRTPSLFLLPGCYVSNQFDRDKDALQVPTRSDKARNLSCFKNTGILGRSDGEVLVAQLEVGYDVPYRTAELCVLHPGAQDWVLKRVPIVHHEGEGVLVRDWTDVDATVSVGSRFMCWVDYLSGFLLCDMAEENPKLRYVALPVPPPKMRHRSSERQEMGYCRKLANAGPGAVRFVSVAPRCCCGGPGKTTCERSSFAFNVTTWTLTLSTAQPMAWVKQGVLDCDELWQLPNYMGLPHVAPRYPILCSDDPDIIYFTVCENDYFIDDADETVWMVEINTRTKVLLSVVRMDTESYMASDFLAAKLHL